MLNYAITVLEGLSEEMGGISFHAPINGPALAGWTALRVPGEQAESLLYVRSPRAAAKLSNGCGPLTAGARENISTAARGCLWRGLCSTACGASARLPSPLLPWMLRCFPEVTSPGRGGRGPISELSRPPCPIPALVRVQMVTEAAQNPS